MVSGVEGQEVGAPAGCLCTQASCSSGEGSDAVAGTTLVSALPYPGPALRGSSCGAIVSLGGHAALKLGWGTTPHPPVANVLDTSARQPLPNDTPPGFFGPAEEAAAWALCRLVELDAYSVSLPLSM